jgi:hypothetical protein
MNIDSLVRNFVNQTNGQIFTVIFRKKNGEIREMNCRTGVVKHLRGGEKKGDDERDGNVTVYDLRVKGYRRFKTANVMEIRHGKKSLKIS